jgi:hypothetical protein
VPSDGGRCVRVCSVEGCDRKHFARGWCKPHYERDRRYGDPFYAATKPDERRVMVTPETDPYGQQRKGLRSRGRLAATARRLCGYEDAEGRCERPAHGAADLCQSHKALARMAARREQYEAWDTAAAIARFKALLAEVYGDDDDDAAATRTGVEYRRRS